MGDRLVLYASVWRRVFALCEVVGEPLERDHPRWPWTVAIETLLVVPVLDAAPPVEAIGVAARSMSQQSHIRIERAHYERAVEAIASIALLDQVGGSSGSCRRKPAASGARRWRSWTAAALVGVFGLPHRDGGRLREQRQPVVLRLVHRLAQPRGLVGTPHGRSPLGFESHGSGPRAARGQPGGRVNTTSRAATVGLWAAGPE